MFYSALRKIRILLEALERAEKDIEYYALDLSLTELERTLSAIPKGSFKHVKCFGLHGTYDDGLEWLKSAETATTRQKNILSLGSSIGNFKRDDGAQFLKRFSDILRPGDTMIIGMDGCQDRERVYHAYNDSKGLTYKFYANGLLNANRILGEPVFVLDNWEIVGEYNELKGRHEAFIAPREETKVGDVVILKGEKVRLEEAYKYDASETSNLWKASGAIETCIWSNKHQNYG